MPFCSRRLQEGGGRGRARKIERGRGRQREREMEIERGREMEEEERGGKRNRDRASVTNCELKQLKCFFPDELLSVNSHLCHGLREVGGDGG